MESRGCHQPSSNSARRLLDHARHDQNYVCTHHEGIIPFFTAINKIKAAKVFFMRHACRAVRCSTSLFSVKHGSTSGRQKQLVNVTGHGLPPVKSKPADRRGTGSTCPHSVRPKGEYPFQEISGAKRLFRDYSMPSCSATVHTSRLSI
jgi:hypothetical protein